MNINNQPSCPPRLTSYDSAVDHKNINNMQPGQRTSIHIPNQPGQRASMHIPNQPGQRASMHIPNQPGQRTSMHIPNQPGQRASMHIPNQPGQRASMHIPNQPGQRASIHIPNGNFPPPQNSINGNILYNANNNAYPINPHIPPHQRLNTTGDLSMQKINSNNHNTNVMNPNDLQSNMNSDFNTNFYNKDEKYNKRLGFFHFISNLKLISKQSKYSKWTLISIIIQVIIIVMLEALLLINYFNYYFTFKKNNEEEEKLNIGIKEENVKNINQMKSILIYQVIFIIAQLFVLALYYDSFRISSSVQLITISGFNFIIAAYSGCQIIQHYRLFSYYEKKINFQNISDDYEYKLIYVCLFSIFFILTLSAIILLIMSFILFKKFGWNIYRNVGADIQKTLILKRRYNFGIIIKFKTFFIFGTILQCILFEGEDINWNADNDNILDNFMNLFQNIEILLKYSVYILIGIFIINIICGAFAVKYESKTLMVIHVFTDIIFIIFAILIVYYIHYGEEKLYDSVQISLTGFSVIDIFLILISIYFSVIVMADFNTVDLTENKHQFGRRLSL